MNSFVVAAPAVQPEETPIASSEFWPTIDPVKIREAQRIDNTVTPARLKATLIEAIAATNASLLTWRADKQLLGHASLAAMPAEQIDGTSILVHRYQRAVGCMAKALLLERYRDFDSTAKGDKKAEALDDPIDDCRRDHHFALADLTGRTRSTVELI